METVRELSTGVCASAVILGAVYVICPNGKMSGPVKYVMGLIMMLCVLSPFFTSSFSFSRTAEEADLKISAEGMMTAQTEYVVSELLEDNGISVDKIKVYMDISKNGSISIYRIKLYGVSSDTAKALLEKSMNGCEVILENE